MGYPSASHHPLRWSKGSRAFGKGILGIPWGAGLALSHREMLQKGRTACTGRSGKKRSVRQRLCVPLVECQIERGLRICRKHPLVCRSALTHRRIEQAGNRKGAEKEVSFLSTRSKILVRHLVSHSQRKRADSPKIPQCRPVACQLVLARPLMAWRTTSGIFQKRQVQE